MIIKPGNTEKVKRLLVPTAVIGVGGYGKLVLPRVDAYIQKHYGYRPMHVPLRALDFDEANGEFIYEGNKYSTSSYLSSLPQEPLADVAAKLKKKNKEKLIPYYKVFLESVLYDYVEHMDGPGLKLFMQSANLAWRLVWKTSVLPELRNSVKKINPTPQEINRLENEEGLQISNRRVIFVVAGGGSTTGPSGLIPILVELSNRKPPNTNLFVIVFTPRSYRDKTDQHRQKGRAIFKATMLSVFDIFKNGEFNEPYDISGDYYLKLERTLFDHLFLVDGTLSGGRAEYLENNQVGGLVANFIYKITTSSLGEKVLGDLGNFNSGLSSENEKEGDPWKPPSSTILQASR